MKTPLLVLCCQLLSSVGASAAENASVRVVVHDEDGHVLPFRGYLQDSAGHTVQPAGTVAIELKKSYDERHFLATGEIECPVPAGSCMLRVERGLEWQPSSRRIDVLEGEAITVNMLLHRWIDMNALGWYSGDMHIHRNPGDVTASMGAEDLNFAANTALWNENNLYTRLGLPLPRQAYEVLDAARVVNVRTQETERLGKGWGAALFLGDFEPVPLPSAPFYPLTAAVCAEARKHGAHIDFEKPVWRDLPVCAALGLVDSIGVVHNHFHPQAFLPMGLVRDAIVPPPRLDMSPRECALYTLDLYYKLLNCGLRIPVSAGSASGVMPSWIGYERTYVKMSEPFSGDAWLRALRAGNSFATNGPVLFLQVGDAEPGAVFELPAPRAPIRIRVEARVREHSLELLEVLHNGEVVARATSETGADNLKIDETLEAGPGWIAARCFEPGGVTQVYAATSPVYLERDGKQGVVPESAHYYEEFVQSLIDQADGENRFSAVGERAAAMETLRKALRFYRELAGNR